MARQLNNKMHCFWANIPPVNLPFIRTPTYSELWIYVNLQLSWMQHTRMDTHARLGVVEILVEASSVVMQTSRFLSLKMRVRLVRFYP